MIGQKFGRLTVIEKAPSKLGKAHWICKCDCGNISQHSVSTGALRSGTTQSCGCLHHEIAVKIGKSKALHKARGTSLYNAWQGMKSRCNYKKGKAYKNYGGRGIKVCSEWENDFLVFYEWSIKNGYKEGLSIDRIDNDGDYEPSNCRWATDTEQLNNTRANVKITFMNQTKTVTQWAKEFGIKRHNLYRWIKEGKNINVLLMREVMRATGRPEYKRGIKGGAILPKLTAEIERDCNSFNKCNGTKWEDK